jgi:hypothetical protein
VTRRRGQRGGGSGRRGTPAVPSALTSSAQVLGTDPINRDITIQPNEPQKEAWQFYRALGEVQFGVGVWLAGCVSRVRLVAAEIQPGGDEPIPLQDGPAAELVSSLAGGIGGQTAMLKKLAVHLSVPGDSYVVGEDPTGVGDPARFDWKVLSSSELQVARRDPLTYRVMEYEGRWRTLQGEYFVCRVWNPDDEFSWRASSSVMSALPIMREVDYWNRYIIAILLSRLAMNGMLLVPSEVTFPADPNFKDAADPFLAKLVDTASKAIRNPGTAAAAIPIPLRVPADYIEKIRHLTFDTQVEDKVQEHRQAALTRLATALNLPAEVLTGMGKVNHWGQWQLEESGIKIHISPLVEIICHGLTMGYLQRMAQAAGVELVGPNGGRVIMWYDPTELTQQPDRAAEAQAIYDRGDLTPEALLRESGLEDDDMPTDDEFRSIALKKIALGGGADALTALGLLTNDESLIPVPTAAPTASGEAVSSSPGTEPAPAGTEPTAEPPTEGPPPTRRNPAPSRTAAVDTADEGNLVFNVPARANGDPILLGDVARERSLR